MAAARSVPGDRSWVGEVESMARLTARAGTVLCLAAATVVVSRRLCGALTRPLPTTELLFLGLLLLAAAAATASRRGVSHPLEASPPARRRYVGRSIAALATWALAWAVSLPGTPRAALGVFWLLVISGELLRWLGPPDAALAARLLAWRRAVPGPRNRSQALATAQAVEPIADYVAADEEDPEAGDLLPPEISQRILRAYSEHGGELIYGTIQCDFRGGQRQQNLHLAFCPPLASIPDLSADQLAGPPVQIRPTLVESFGAVLELKLSSPSKQPERVQLQFYASERPADAGGL
jgi:hypothetical protein